MKKIYPLFILILFISTLHAQELPNGDFETWETVGTSEEPVPFNTPNPFTSLVNATTVSKSEDAFGGMYSCMLESILISVGPFQYNVPGLITYADFDVDFITQEATITGGLFNPNMVLNLSGKYKYTGAEGDSASVLIYSFAHPEGEDIDTIGIGSTFLHDAEEWTDFSVPMVQLSENAPDTFNLIIMSAGSFNLEEVKPGSILLVDDLMIETNVGIFSLPEKMMEVSVFPNPASDYVIFETTETNPDRRLSVYDINGRKVKELEFASAKLSMEVTDLPTGNYSFIMSAKNEWLGSGSFIKK